MKNNKLILYFAHVFLVFPFLLYVGLQKNKNKEFIYNILIFIGIVLFIYHGYRAYINYKIFNKINSLVVINILHILFFGTFFIYIGSKKNNSMFVCYDILIMLAFAALGPNLIKLVKHYLNNYYCK